MSTNLIGHLSCHFPIKKALTPLQPHLLPSRVRTDHAFKHIKPRRHSQSNLQAEYIQTTIDPPVPKEENAACCITELGGHAQRRQECGVFSRIAELDRDTESGSGVDREACRRCISGMDVMGGYRLICVGGGFSFSFFPSSFERVSQCSICMEMFCMGHSNS